MPRTQFKTTQIQDQTIGRPDIDVTNAATALITKVIAGVGTTLAFTGPVAGTGDVTVHVVPQATITTSEALAAGAWVNVWNNSGAFAVRNANASTAGKEVHGYVLVAASSGQPAIVYFGGINTAVSGMTPGYVFLQTTAGVGGATVPSGAVGSGIIVQNIGIAANATSVIFEPQPSITL